MIFSPVEEGLEGVFSKRGVKLMIYTLCLIACNPYLLVVFEGEIHQTVYLFVAYTVMLFCELRVIAVDAFKMSALK